MSSIKSTSSAPEQQMDRKNLLFFVLILNCIAWGMLISMAIELQMFGWIGKDIPTYVISDLTSLALVVTIVAVFVDTKPLAMASIGLTLVVAITWTVMLLIYCFLGKYYIKDRKELEKIMEEMDKDWKRTPITQGMHVSRAVALIALSIASAGVQYMTTFAD